MTEIKRYNSELELSPTGGWVDYEDAQQALAEKDKRIAELWASLTKHQAVCRLAYNWFTRDMSDSPTINEVIDQLRDIVAPYTAEGGKPE